VPGTAKQEAYYLIAYTATDAAGNQSTITRSIPVLHDPADIPQAGRKPVQIKSPGPPAFASPTAYSIARSKR